MVNLTSKTDKCYDEWVKIGTKSTARRTLKRVNHNTIDKTEVSIVAAKGKYWTAAMNFT